MKYLLCLLSMMFLLSELKAQPIYFNWVKQIGGTGDDMGSSIAIDNFGNTYSTGNFKGTLDFDPGPGIINLTSKGASDIFILKLDASGNLVWAKQMGGNLDDAGASITIDNLGNIYLTGIFKDKVDFDPNSGVFNLISKGGDDIFILKLTLSGNFIWAKQIGGVSFQICHDITTDRYGNVLTTGEFSKTTDFDPGVDSFNYTTQFGNGLFVSKLDSSGKFLWAKKFEGIAWNQSISITTDLSDNVFFTGDFGAELDFNPGPGVFKLTTLPDSFDIFICKLNPLGNFVWAKQIGGTAFSMGASIISDKSGYILTTGFFRGKVDFDPHVSKTNYLSANSKGYGSFISKLDSFGNFVWAKQLGGDEDVTGSSIKIDGSGNIYSVGTYTGIEDFDPGTGVFNLQSNGYDAYVSKLDPSRNFIWAKNLGGSAQTGINDFVLDEFGNIYSAGYFKEETDFNPDSESFNLTSNGGFDIFIHKLGKNSLKINQGKDKSFLKIYPNPNNGIVNISFEKLTNNGHLKVFNIHGQTIIENNNVNEKTLTVDISNQKNGIYFIEVSDNHNLSILRFVKN